MSYGARAVLALTVALLVLAPATTAAPWMQPRGDAAATGFQSDDGPEWPDVALKLTLEGNWWPEAAAPPLILNDSVVFLARPWDDPDDTEYRVFSVDVDSGELTTIADGIARAPRLALASDGSTVYVSSLFSVHAVPLRPGGNEWTWDGGTQVAGAERTRAEYCRHIVLEPTHVILACVGRAVEDDAFCTIGNTATPFTCTRLSAKLLVVRLDAATGEAQWVFDPGRSPGPDRTRDLDSGQPLGLAVGDGRVLVHTLNSVWTRTGEDGYDVGRLQHWLWALEKEPDDEAGSLDWVRSIGTSNRTRVGLDDAQVDRTEPLNAAGNPAIADGAAYVKAGRVMKINLGTGETLWSRPIGDEDVEPDGTFFGTGVALDDEHVYTTSSQTAYRIARDNHESGWSTSLNFSAGQRFNNQPIVTPSRLYTATFSDEGTESIYAFGSGDGSVDWHHRVEGRINAITVGTGLVAYTTFEQHDDSANTTLVLLGKTEASPSAVARTPTLYPARDQLVTVDLSESGPGLHGAPTRYRAIWGDGTVSAWQNGSSLSHRYAAEGDVEARFLVGNEAGQTASTTRTFHVGAEAPTEPNLVEQAFQRENQDLTFGVLGVLLALTGGAIGVTRRYRHRSRLQDELQAVEKAYEETRRHPMECESQLTERMTHARGLLLDGQLTDDQFRVVERRIEELRRGLRLGALEEEFGFLPHILVVKAREMLDDGRVTTLEAEAFLVALDEVDDISEDQRATVRERIQTWRARDTAAT